MRIATALFGEMVPLSRCIPNKPHTSRDTVRPCRPLSRVSFFSATLLDRISAVKVPAVAPRTGDAVSAENFSSRPRRLGPAASASAVVPSWLFLDAHELDAASPTASPAQSAAVGEVGPEKLVEPLRFRDSHRV